MKKIVLTLAALAAFTGSAMAADLAPRYNKAPAPLPPPPSWTGFYIFGGGGGGIWDADTSTRDTATNAPLTINQRQGGDGWFGTVGIGYDWAGQQRLGRRHFRGWSVRQPEAAHSGPGLRRQRI